MSPSARTLLLVAFAHVAVIPALADQTGEIRGLVTDAAGEPLPGVVVTARSPSLQGQRSAATDARGTFRLPLLPVGTYVLKLEIQGFETQTLTDNAVRLGGATPVLASMKLSALKEQITVTAETPLIDATKTDTSYRLRGGDLARVPAQGRTIAEVVAYTPGVTAVRVNTVTGSDAGLPSFRGEGDAGNNWLVDGLSTKGVNRNDPGVRINYDAWDEVQVVSDGFSPEFGQTMGAVVNVVTKSGGNSFQGEAGALIQGRSLRAQRQDQLSAASLPETSIGQYYANLGGPILKDRLWFFLSDNFLSTADRTTDQTVGWLEIPAGQRKATSNNAFGKVTWTPAVNHTISLGGTLDTSLDQTGGIGVPALYTTASYENWSYRLNYTGILRSDLFVTAAAGQNRRDNSTAPLSGDYGTPSYYWQDIAQRTNNVNNGLSESERRTDVALAGSWSRNAGRWGNHEVRAGVSYFGNSHQNQFRWTGRNADPWPGNGFDDGTEVTWASPGLPTILMEYQSGLTKNSTRGFGLYLQDTVVLGRVTLMLGLRTDTQKIFNDVGELAWSWNMGDFLQPRVSLAADLTGDGKTVFKAGYGVFAMPLSTQSLGYVFNRFLAFSFRQYSWAGPVNPGDAQLKDPANWQFVWEQSATASPTEVDPGVKPDSLQRVLVSLERQLSAQWALALRGIYSRTTNLLDVPAFYDPGSPNHVKGVFTNFDLKRRDYRALEVELNGRFGTWLFLNASYTWSKARGTSPGNQFEATGWSTTVGSSYDYSPFGMHADMPADDPYKEMVDYLFGGLGGPGVGDEGWYGYLPYSVEHDVKLLATWIAPYGIRVTPAFEWLSGYYWEKKGWSELGYYITFPEGRGSRTTPGHAYFDLAVEKEFRIGKGVTLDVGVNVYNLFNSQVPVSYVKEDTELFGQVWARQLPRWVQLYAKVGF